MDVGGADVGHSLDDLPVAELAGLGREELEAVESLVFAAEVGAHHSVARSVSVALSRIAVRRRARR